VLSPDPYAAEGAKLDSFNSAHSLGDSLILLYGRGFLVNGSAVDDGIGAYNVKTCAFVARASLPLDTLPGRHWTPVALAGWSAADPLKKIEYWRYGSNDQQEVVVHRLNASGALLNTYVLGNVPNDATTGYDVSSLDYNPNNGHFVGTIQPKTGYQDNERIDFARPAPGTPDGTISAVLRTPLPHPCAFDPLFSGTDKQGNSYFAQYSNSTYRVCPLSATGEMADIPFSVGFGSSYANWGMIVPGDSIYGLIQGNAFSLERRALSP
jgi:hypothetical protein